MDNPRFLNLAKLPEVFRDRLPVQLLRNPSDVNLALLLVEQLVSGLLLGEGLLQVHLLAHDGVILLEHQINSLVLVEGDEREATEPLGPLVLHEAGFNDFAVFREILL